MHPQAANWIGEVVAAFELRDADVLDLGGRTINSTVHELFTGKPVVVDIVAAPDVDIVANAATWTPDREYGCVLATEVFEHTAEWPDIVRTAWMALEPDGVFIGTCASRARPPHSATGGPLEEGEFYENVNPQAMRDLMAALDWAVWKVVEADGVFGNDDLYCWGVK